jgi:hypothetical protein
MSVEIEARKLRLAIDGAALKQLAIAGVDAQGVQHDNDAL